MAAVLEEKEKHQHWLRVAVRGWSGVGFHALEGARYAEGARDHCGHGGGEHSQVSEPLVWAYAPYRDCGERIFSVV
jgi:hypothetical protein